MRCMNPVIIEKVVQHRNLTLIVLIRKELMIFLLIKAIIDSDTI